jgi:hypothetical protein
MTISRMFAAVRAQISSNTRDRSSELDDIVGKQPLKSFALQEMSAAWSAICVRQGCQVRKHSRPFVCTFSDRNLQRLHQQLVVSPIVFLFSGLRG